MKTLKLLFIFLLIGLVPAFAARRVETKQLTVSGIAIIGTTINANNVLTSDSVYQNGNMGYETLATQVSGNISTSYQVSYDNKIWWNPNVITNVSGTIGSIATIDSNISSNQWVILPYVLTPYIRFIFTNLNATVTQDAITADVLWQDES